MSPSADGPRHASTYRGARRNRCRREHGIWDHGHYYSERFDPRAFKHSPYWAGQPRGKSFGGWGGMRNFFFPGAATGVKPSAVTPVAVMSRARAAGRGS